MPAASSPGNKMTGRVAPPKSGRLDDDDGSDDGGAEEGGHRGEACCRGNQGEYLVRSVFPG